MSNILPTGCSKLFFDRLDQVAKKTKFIQRFSKKFSAKGYLFSNIHAILTGKASFRQLAMSLKMSESFALSKQAVWMRTNKFAVAFMLEALSLILQEKWQRSVPKISTLKRHFGRILVQDSTQQKLPKANHELFPAHGNGHGHTAGVKVDLAIDLLHGHTVFAHLHGATEQDRDLGKNLVDQVRKRDLILRDRGYFILAEFRLIEGKGAFWLSRVSSNLIIKIAADGSSLETCLEKEKGNLLDTKVTLGEEAHSARLVAIRARPEVAEKALREANESARKRGHTLGRSQRLRCQWHLVVTNISADKLSAAQVSELYRCRWNIEIIFRAWKQSANLDRALNRRSNEDHFQVLMLAGMIYQVMSLSMVALMRTFLKKGQCVSYENLFDNFSEWIMRSKNLRDLWSFAPDPRHVAMEPRKDRRPLEDTWMTLLS